MRFENWTVKTEQDLRDAVGEFGFVPLFANTIPGFSVEEHAHPSVWFSSDEGVWEWKGPVIRATGCAYGKFSRGKAVFVSKEWFSDLANYRRDGYDFDARYDDGLAPFREKELFDLLDANAPVLSRHLKAIGGYGKDGKKDFDLLVNRLQGQCYVLISDFVYDTDRKGKAYGWGVAEYSTPEKFFGPSFRATVYTRTPEESRDRILEHLAHLLPGVSGKTLKKWLER